MGWLGGVAIARASDNVLDELTSSLAPTSVRLGGGIFAFAIIGLGVPVYCVLMRYNLRAGGLSEFWSHILAGAGPWAALVAPRRSLRLCCSRRRCRRCGGGLGAKQPRGYESSAL